MSYSIYYNKQFVKLNNNEYIPMILSGDNNVIEYNGFRRGRGRRARSWQVESGLFETRKFFGTDAEILDGANRIINEAIERNANVKKDWNDKIYTEDEVRNAFGYFTGLAVGTQNTSQCTANKYFNFHSNGIKNALTIEELAEAGVYLYFRHYEEYKKVEFTMSNAEFNHVMIKTTEQFYDLHNKVNNFLQNCTYTDSNGEKQKVYVFLSFNGSSDYVIERVNSYRRKKNPVRYEHRWEDCNQYFVLSQSNRVLVNFTKYGYRYSLHESAGKKFQTYAEANRYLNKVRKEKRKDFEKWQVEQVNKKSSIKRRVKVA